ncbi:MAG: TetR/AcrR family transcriptional regulator [Planctomycetota bacterium]
MATVQRREREKLQRRQDILDAARAVFWERGYTGTTMPEIAEAAELAPGTLYLYFPSKSALYAELLLEGYDVLLARLEAQVAEEAPPRMHAEALIDLFFRFAEDHPEYFDIIFFVLQREAGGTRGGALEPEQVQRLQAKENACKAIAAQVLERAGYERPADELRTTVDAIWSMLVGTIFYFRNSTEQALERVAAEARKMILDSLFGGE